MKTQAPSPSSLIHDAAKKIRKAFPKKRIDLAETEAWWLLESITQKPRVTLQLQEHPLKQQQLKNFSELIAQRTKQKKPLQYLLGSVPFCGLEIKITPPILIPRQETEEWVTWLIEQLQPFRHQPLRILDLCTGSGCIGLALAHALPKATIIGIDINPQAIKLAKQNKQLNRIKNIQFIQSDLYTKLPQQKPFDIIVSNPPYITQAEWEKLASEVRTWEDKHALIAPKQGMLVYEKILSGLDQYLKKESHLLDAIMPRVVLEIGKAQTTRALMKLFYHFNIQNYRVYRDLQGKSRWVALSV